MSDTHPHVAVAERLTRCLLAGDVDGVADVYADDVAVWRNFDLQTIGKKQTVKVVGFLVKSVKELRYDDVRVQATPGGFVQQHVLRGIAPNGKSVEAHACLVAQVSGGRIVRLDEYIDSAQLAPLLG